MSTLKLEVRQAADQTWHWRRRVNGRIMAHGADYNTKSSAVRGCVDDMVACTKHCAGLAYTILNVDEERRLRKHLRKQVEEVA